MLFTGWHGFSMWLSDPSPFVEMGSPVFNMVCGGRGEWNHQVDQSANGARRFLVVAGGGADAAWFGWFRRE
jgi:hypothetical protein